MTDLTEEEENGLLVQAAECPVIRGALSTGDPEVIKRVEAIHPPKHCAHVKVAAETVAAKRKPP